jgi:hypothetical protein
MRDINKPEFLALSAAALAFYVMACTVSPAWFWAGAALNLGLLAAFFISGDTTGGDE